MASIAPRGGSRRRRTISEINMVPFIDVMLVLLIIFMVTAPLIAPSQIDLPSVGQASRQPERFEQVIGKDERLQLRRATARPKARTCPWAQLVARVKRCRRATRRCRWSSAPTQCEIRNRGEGDGHAAARRRQRVGLSVQSRAVEQRFALPTCKRSTCASRPARRHWPAAVLALVAHGAAGGGADLGRGLAQRSPPTCSTPNCGRARRWAAPRAGSTCPAARRQSPTAAGTDPAPPPPPPRPQREAQIARGLEKGKGRARTAPRREGRAPAGRRPNGQGGTRESRRERRPQAKAERPSEGRSKASASSRRSRAGRRKRWPAARGKPASA